MAFEFKLLAACYVCLERTEMVIDAGVDGPDAVIYVCPKCQDHAVDAIKDEVVKERRSKIHLVK